MPQYPNPQDAWRNATAIGPDPDPYQFPALADPYGATIRALKKFRPYDPDAPIENPRSRFEQFKQQQNNPVEMPTPPAAPRLAQNAPYQPDVPNYLPIQEGPPRVAQARPEPAVSALRRYTPDPSEGNAVRSGLGANDPMELLRLREQRQGELQNSLTSGVQDQYQATQLNRLGQVNTDIADDPFTGENERARTGAIQGLVSQAQLGGFDSPQAQAQYARQQEERKLNMPAEVARVQGGFDIGKQEAANRGALDVQESRGAQSQNFLEMLNNARMSGANVSGVTLPQTGGSVRFQTEQQIPPALSNAVTAARGKYEQAKGLFSSGAAEKAQLDQAIQAALMRYPADSALKEAAFKWGNAPELSRMTLPEILQVLGETEITPEETAQLREMLTIVRGR